ncbi:MAG TPA: PhzF family phenazine biosynthesis protein [Saprospiraceae bacterium]|nr:PhzF family phenazine biosynthesis protein [Saprospiraceae bacterium]HMQ84841.1 PhzF family phenazine biosynthesis protein [Saprospiraceae bacterium]
MEIAVYQVDAFTDQLFKGNPAAVCPLDKWLPDAHMQAIAAENNLSETAFFVARGGVYDLRWFTPAIEVDLCGHATLATTHVLFKHLNYAAQTIVFETRSGQLLVSQSEGLYIMDFPSDQLEPVLPPAVLEQALGITPQEVWMGREDYLVILDSEAAVAALKPDFALLKQLQGRGVICSAKGDQVDFVSRCFFPNAGIDEDPVTGSAHTTMTPYWAEKLGKQQLKGLQISKRGGQVQCTMLGDRVALAGQAVTFLEGKLYC